MKENKKLEEQVLCECGYHNLKANIDRYGTCKLCGKVLDEKAKFKYEMFCKLNLWRFDKNRRSFK